ncbi:MAG: AAA family ATPase [Bacteroides sp.]|nr:AAA family ATPase [Bacteroides sp.]
MNEQKRSTENPELALAWRFVSDTGTHLFLTGKAGTGKTTFLKRLKSESPKRMIVLAPTGIAAINAGGVTIHSFFQLPFAPFLPGASFTAGGSAPSFRYRFGKEKINILRSIDLLVIDEISMVRADLLDAVDEVMRRYRDRTKPFGGVQLLMIGDLQQLAPVVKDEEWQMLKTHYATPYFFSSKALEETTYCTIELKTVYRQSDSDFLNLLNSIRENRAGSEVMETLNRRYVPGFRPARDDGYIRLVTHNAQAQRINDHELEVLPGRSFAYRASIEGKFPELAYPTDLLLELKPGAQVMFVKNDTSGEHRYYNGMIGEVTALSSQSIEVRPQGSPSAISVQQEEWSNARYVLDEESKEIREEVEGTFRQYPLKLAWAITIHKSQGLTFDKAIIDASGSFAHGQTYVALSRCRTLQGLVLSAPLSSRAIISDAQVDAFTDEARQTMPDNRRLSSLARSYYVQLLDELFDFSSPAIALSRYVRLVDEHLFRLYPKLLQSMKSESAHFADEVIKVARKFSLQYTRLVEASADYQADTHLQERISAAAAYFTPRLQPLQTLLQEGCPGTDNKELKKKLHEAADELQHQLALKLALLKFVQHEGFQTASYLKKKALLSIDDAPSTPSPAKRKKKEAAITVPSDVLHPRLYQRLIAWRNAEAARLGLPVYTVLQQKAVLGISNLRPADKAALLRIPYVGQKVVEKYGDDILATVRSCP